MAGLLLRERLVPLHVEVDESAARRDLRRQIGNLERELAGLLGDAFGRVEIDYRVDAVAAGPRLLDLGELERLRDEFAERIAEARRTLTERARVETANRELLERMLAAPAEHKWVQVSRHDIGAPGCGHWHSRPVLGPIGMLMGWWRVKVSSGCPLAGRLAAVEHQAQGEEEDAAGLRGQAESGRVEAGGDARLRSDGFPHQAPLRA